MKSIKRKNKNSDKRIIFKFNFLRDKNIKCDKYDPIYLFGERFKKKPVTLCKSKKSNHICYQTSKYNNNQKIAEIKYGFVCKSENFILDPFKSSLID